jgi:flagellin
MALSINGASGALATLQALSTSGGAGAPAAASAATPTPASISSESVRSSAVQGAYVAADAVSQALTAADAAGAAGQTVLGLLHQMQSLAGQASVPGLSSTDRAQLSARFQDAAGQIGPALSGAGVNGLNLVDGSQQASVKLALADGATASLTPANLAPGGPVLGTPPGVDTATAASSSLLTLGTALGAASDALSTLQGQAAQVDAHAGFVQQLGLSSAPSGDDGGDSVRLLALQISQQLSAQPSGVANAAPQAVLSLFRS